MDYHMHLHYNPYGNPYWDMKLIKHDFIYGLPYNFMNYQMVSHGIAYGKAYLKMEIHKYVFPSEFMDFHMDFQANAYGNP